MDGERFDALVRRALGEASRRGVVRAGIGAFAASALATLGLSVMDDAEAKKKKKKKKKKGAPSSPPPRSACAPRCAGSTACGDDGCGGSCGSCGGGQRCCAGRCQSNWANLTTFGDVGSGLGELDGPFGVAVSPDGQTVWVADTFNERIAVWTKTGPTTWTNPTVLGGPDDGLDPGQFDSPHGVAVFGDEQTITVADTRNQRISVWLQTGATTWAPQTTFPDPGGETGSGPSEFNSPEAVAVSGDGKTVWVADTKNHRITVWTETEPGAWENLTTFGGFGSGPSQFHFPEGVAVSSDEETAWVADSGNNRIAVWTRTGPTSWETLTTFGSGGSAPSELAGPAGVAVSRDGRTVWVADSGNNRIAVWIRTGPTTWENQDTFGSEGSEASQFKAPAAVAFASDEQTLWVADLDNHRIAVWTLVCSPV